MDDNPSPISSKFSSTPPNNPPVLQSKYPILNSHNINTSTWKEYPLDVIYLKNILSKVSCVLKDDDINMHLEKWGGRGKKELIQIPSVGHLKYEY